MSSTTSKPPSFHHQACLDLVQKFPIVDSKGDLSGPLPDEFKRVIFYPPNASMLGTYPLIMLMVSQALENPDPMDYLRRPIIIWAPDLMWNE